MKINAITPQYNLSNKSVKEKQGMKPSFNGLAPKPVVDGLAKFYNGVASTDKFQKLIKGFSNSDRSFTHIMVIESILLSGFYMLNTLTNKKIKKEQKPQMIINDTLTLGVSAAGAYLVEDKITNVVMKGAEKFFANNKEFYTNLGKEAANASKSELLSKVAETAVKTGEGLSKGIENVVQTVGSQLKGVVGEEGKLKAFQMTKQNLSGIQDAVREAVVKNAGNADKAKEAVKSVIDDAYNNAAARGEVDKILPGINKLKVIIVLGLIYRYLGPVVITPIANKLSSKLFNNKKEAQKPETQEKVQTQEKK